MRSTFRVADYVAPENATLTAELLKYSLKVAKPDSPINNSLCSCPSVNHAVTFKFVQDAVKSLSTSSPIEEALIQSGLTNVKDLHPVTPLRSLYLLTMNTRKLNDDHGSSPGRRLRAWWAYNLAVVASRRPVPTVTEGELT